MNSYKPVGTGSHGSFYSDEPRERRRAVSDRISTRETAAIAAPIDVDPTGERCDGLRRLTRVFAAVLARVKREHPYLSNDAAKEVVWRRLEALTGKVTET